MQRIFPKNENLSEVVEFKNNQIQNPPNKKSPPISQALKRKQISLKKAKESSQKKQNILKSAVKIILQDKNLNKYQDTNTLLSINKTPNKFSKNKKNEAKLNPFQNIQENSLETTIKKIQNKDESILKDSNYENKETNKKSFKNNDENSGQNIQNSFCNFPVKENINPVNEKMSGWKDSDFFSIVRKTSQDICKTFIS